MVIVDNVFLRIEHYLVWINDAYLVASLLFIVFWRLNMDDDKTFSFADGNF